MADLTLNVIITDVNVPLAIPPFLRACPVPMVRDPNDPEQMIPEFSNNKEWAEEVCRRHILRIINHGIDIIAQDEAVKLTKDIFGVVT